MADVRDTGAGVIPSAFSGGDIETARRTISRHLGLMKKTRPTPSARHLAGFHRFPALEPLHLLLTQNAAVRSCLGAWLGKDLRTIGLSDITVNRSQPWHKDLLRGAFRHHLDVSRPCERHHGKLFKVIAYLQDSRSLRIVPGSQRRDVDLIDDAAAVPPQDAEIRVIEARAGDAVIIDLCTTHRGSSEEDLQDPRVERHPRMLVSTVFGAAHCDFANRMELGNAARLAAWVERHADH